MEGGVRGKHLHPVRPMGEASTSRESPEGVFGCPAGHQTVALSPNGIKQIQLDLNELRKQAGWSNDGLKTGARDHVQGAGVQAKGAGHPVQGAGQPDQGQGAGDQVRGAGDPFQVAGQPVQGQGDGHPAQGFRQKARGARQLSQIARPLTQGAGHPAA